MAFSLWNLIEASILCLNAICILNEDRFLSKYGWSSKNTDVHGFGEAASTKGRILKLIHSIRTVVTVPLILLNVVAIVFKLLFG